MGTRRTDHDDGSYTDRHDDFRNSSETYSEDGTLRERTVDESSLPFGEVLGHFDERVTRDAEGNVINVTPRKK